MGNKSSIIDNFSYHNFEQFRKQISELSPNLQQSMCTYIYHELCNKQREMTFMVDKSKSFNLIDTLKSSFKKSLYALLPVALYDGLYLQKYSNGNIIPHNVDKFATEVRNSVWSSYYFRPGINHNDLVKLVEKDTHTHFNAKTVIGKSIVDYFKIYMLSVATNLIGVATSQLSIKLNHNNLIELEKCIEYLESMGAGDKKNEYYPNVIIEPVNYQQN